MAYLADSMWQKKLAMQKRRADRMGDKAVTPEQQQPAVKKQAVQSTVPQCAIKKECDELKSLLLDLLVELRSLKQAPAAAPPTIV
jgi:hypothetical protein